MNSGDLVRFILSESLTSDEVLVSSDVVSLFTSIPTDLTVDIARRCLKDPI